MTDPTTNAAALAALGFHHTFTNHRLGWHDSRVGAVDLCARFGWSARSQHRAAATETRTRPDGTTVTVNRSPGPVRTLIANGALTRTPRHTKTADCVQCGASTGARCAPDCTERTGRLDHEPVYTPEQAPPAGWAHPGPMDLGEYYHPDRIAARLNGTGTDTDRTIPYAQVPTWVILHPDLSDLAVAVFIWLCAHTTLSRGRLLARVGRPRIADRFGISTTTVSRVLGALEQVGAVLRVTRVRRGTVAFGDGRWCHTLIRTTPPDGLAHPHPASPAEWRDEDRLGARVGAHTPPVEDGAEPTRSQGDDPHGQGSPTHRDRGDNPPAHHPPAHHPPVPSAPRETTGAPTAPPVRTDGWDIIEAALRALPAHVRPLARAADAAALARAADARLAEGWTMADLGACLGHDHGRLRSAWGLMARLADPHPWVPGAFTGTRLTNGAPAADAAQGWCGSCSDPVHRWRYLDPDAETGPYRCTCHPTVGARF